MPHSHGSHTAHETGYYIFCTEMTCFARGQRVHLGCPVDFFQSASHESQPSGRASCVDIEAVTLAQQIKPKDGGAFQPVCQGLTRLPYMVAHLLPFDRSNLVEDLPKVLLGGALLEGCWIVCWIVLIVGHVPRDDCSPLEAGPCHVGFQIAIYLFPLSYPPLFGSSPLSFVWITELLPVVLQMWSHFSNCQRLHDSVSNPKLINQPHSKALCT